MSDLHPDQPTKGELRRIRLRRARIFTAALSVVAAVVLGVLLATTDPSRASSPSAARVRSTPAPTAPSNNGDDGGGNFGDGNNSGGGNFSNGNSGGSVNNGGNFNSSPSPDTQTRGS